MATAQELPINTGASALQMALEIFGDSVTVVDADYRGDAGSSGIWTDGDAIAPGVTPSDTGVMFSTGRLTSFTNAFGDPNRSASTSSNTSGINNDSDFNTLAGRSTYDASILEVDFIPTTSVLSMQFTFASEEYPEYVGSIFNDAVGIWINGVEVGSPVFSIADINSVNGGANETLYVDNTGDDYNTEMDGFTVTLNVTIPVNVGQVNSLKLGIADVGDSSYDSTLLVAAGSIQGDVIANNDTGSVYHGHTLTLDVLANDTAGMSVTHINGQEISTGGTVTLSSGHEIELLSDGRLGVTAPNSNSTATETQNFSYTAETASGISDSAFATITTIPCFTRGTHILTPHGYVPVEDLTVGQMVETQDHGPRPIRWIGTRTAKAEGPSAPIVIEQGTFGLHKRLVISPLHRILISNVQAELLFGEDEVLIAAKDLVNNVSVWVKEGGNVEYFHILFDQHEIIWSEGLATESLFPGAQTLAAFDEATRERLFSLFPALNPSSGQGYGDTVRLPLKSFEAKVVFG
ncbi:Hint domain-containing protein [Rhodophyticola sp. SM2404]